MNDNVTVIETNREWKSLNDTEFKDKTSLKRFNGRNNCEHGKGGGNWKTDEEFIEPTFSQRWPYNSYIKDETIRQGIINQGLLPFVGTFYDFKNISWGHWNWDEVAPAAFDVLFPVVGNLLGSFLERRHKKKRKGKNLYNNLEPAGCGPIAILTLMWLFRDYECVQDYYDGIETLSPSYKDKDETLEKIMKTIFRKNLCLQNIDYNGTSSIINYLSLPLKKYKHIKDNSTRENEAKTIFEAIALNSVPVIVTLKKDDDGTGGHFAIIQGIDFDYNNYLKTGNFKDSMKLYVNMGWGKGPEEKLSVNDITNSNGKKYEIRNLHVYAPPTKKTYTYNYDYNKNYAIATAAEQALAIRRRKEFDDLVGKNYEVAPAKGCKFRKGEVVHINNGTAGVLPLMAVVVSQRLKNDKGDYYYKVSYATQAFKDSLETNQTITAILVSSLVSRTYNISESCLSKVFSKTLDCVFFRETNGILANAQVYVNKYAVGQYIYDEPTLINKSNFLGLGAAYISKIYADTSCDIYFPDRKKTLHSAICFGDDYVENYNIPSTTQIPAKFEKGEVVYFKDNNAGGTIYKTTISSTEMFVVGLQRTYLVKNAGGITIQVGESALYKIVHTYNYSAY